MTIKQSAALLVLMAAMTLAGAGCLPRPTANVQPDVAAPAEPAETETAAEAANTADDQSDWVRYDAAQAGQVGMSFLYPPGLAPVPWDTAAWGANAVGADFTGFGIARIPNPSGLTVAEWLARQYPDFAFAYEPVERDHPFNPAIPSGACEAYVVNDIFDEELGPSGIGGTVLVNVGDASLYAFALGQDWNQDLGDRAEVIRAITGSIEWFAERTDCGAVSTVRDDLTGIAFEVPASLSPVIAQDEFGFGTEVEDGPMNCLTSRAYLSLADGSNTLFLTANDTWACIVPGRDGYWGDQARAFETPEDVAAWCAAKDSCESFVNANGVTLWHAYSKTVEDWGSELSDIHEYAAFNPDRSVHGVLLSNQGFARKGVDGMTDEVAAIADSLRFLE